jgi:DNA helicase HerA-like ATPase
MILGKIIGRITTQEFSFDITGKVKKFDYIQVLHAMHGYVLCQVIDIRVDESKRRALCQVIGYNRKGKIHSLRVPFEPGSEVLKAENKFIKEVIKIEDEQGAANLGTLEGKEIPVSVNLSHVLTKHIGVLAKTGSGKSYAVGVLLEEILDKKVPVLIIDPHGEYSTLRQKNNNKEDVKKLRRMNLKPKSFVIKEYGDPQSGLNPLKLSNQLNQQELIELFPGKLSSAQMGILYSAMQDMPTLDFNTLLFRLESEEASGKWNLIHTLQYLKGLDIFSDHNTPFSELIQSGRATILNLKGYSPDVQDMMVYLLSKNLFQLRKEGKIAPFFLVVEEAHNFCPERSFGEKKSNKILRTIASEGRKFGLGLCIVTQRPARVDKSVLSQCGTQIILKVTNPNDLKAVSNSVEGLTSSTEKEIQNLNIGTALLTGVTELPLLVNIRPRLTLHGGHAINLLDQAEEDFQQQKQSFEEKEMLSVIKPTISINDFKIMNDAENVQTNLIPAYQFRCKDSQGEFFLLVELVNGKVITDIDTFEAKKLPDFTSLERQDIMLLKHGYVLKNFSLEQISKKVGRLIEKKELQNLLLKAYLVSKNGSFMINDEFLFTKLRNAANFSKPEYLRLDANKREGRLSADQIREKISKLVPVVDSTECYVVKYEKA